MKKKTVRSSNLALRFYMNDGWTREELEDCLETGRIIVNGDFGSELDIPYYMLDVGSRFDLEKLMPLVGKVERAFDDYPWQTDREFIESHMW